VELNTLGVIRGVIIMGNVRWGLLAFMLCAMALGGIEFVLGGGLRICVSLVLAVAAIWCCALDGRVCRRPIPHGIQLLMLPVWPVSALAYLIWARGWRGAAFGVIFTILIFTVYAFSVACAYAIVFAHSLSAGEI
jgi:hypothetical protein